MYLYVQKTILCMYLVSHLQKKNLDFFFLLLFRFLSLPFLKVTGSQRSKVKQKKYVCICLGLILWFFQAQHLGWVQLKGLEIVFHISVPAWHLYQILFVHKLFKDCRNYLCRICHVKLWYRFGGNSVIWLVHVVLLFMPFVHQWSSFCL